MCPEIPALSMEAARDIFYDIYGDHGGRSCTVDDLVRRLDFHALSITLLATTAFHNAWGYDRLTEEWETHRTQVLRTDYNESLAATIELSLNSPTFCKLGATACNLLEVVAFFPRGVDEKNLDWFFPTIPERRNTFDKFCALSLTYRSNHFITMLAPIRDHLIPRDPKSSPLLCTTKDHYFTRLSVDLNPNKPEFCAARWIRSEDINVEHLLAVFTSGDTNSVDIWDACVHFLEHLYRHKPRETVLIQKVEGLPDDHHSKSRCLLELSELAGMIGNQAERKRLLTHTLMLERLQGNDSRAARALRRLSDTNRRLHLCKEGIQQAKEASEIYNRLGDAVQQANSLKDLAYLLLSDEQHDAAEDAVTHAIDLIQGKGQEYIACQSHRILGEVHRCKGEKEKAIHNFKVALGIASSFDWHNELFWSHFILAAQFCNGGEFEEATSHIERAKLHAVHNAYNLGRATEYQAIVWYQQGRLEEAACEVLRALEIFERLGAVEEAERCRDLQRSTGKQ